MTFVKEKFQVAIICAMAIILPRYLKYVSVFILIIAILYKYEISSDQKTLLITKEATFQYNRSHVYKIISDIKRYPMVSSSNLDNFPCLFQSFFQWYPNVATVESDPTGKTFRLITKVFLFGMFLPIREMQLSFLHRQ